MVNCGCPDRLCLGCLARIKTLAENDEGDPMEALNGEYGRDLSKRLCLGCPRAR